MRTRRLVAKVLFIIAGICVVIFAVVSAIGWHNYNTFMNSAPFYLFVIWYAVQFLLPAAVLLAIGLILEHEPRKNTD